MINFWVVLLLPLVSCSTFWMSAELMRVDWREGCLTTAGCSQPRFQILEDMLSVSEKQTISWPISEHFAQDSSRHLVSQWAVGKPEDITLSCQVVGTDPTYGFPRVCDQTPSIRIFQSQVADAYDRSRSRRHPASTSSPQEEDLGKRIIEIRAKCFNATLTVQKHTERCPSCPDPQDITVIGQEISEEHNTLSGSLFAQLQGEDRMVHIGVLILAGIAVSTSAAFGCLLVVFLKQKKGSRNCRNIMVKPRHHPYSPALVKTRDDDSTRYDLPWETHHRNLGYWQTKSDCTTTSPLDSSSSLGTRFNYRTTTIPAQPQPLYHHISPNSSIGAHDSGLESV